MHFDMFLLYKVTEWSSIPVKYRAFNIKEKSRVCIGTKNLKKEKNIFY